MAEETSSQFDTQILTDVLGTSLAPKFQKLSKIKYDKPITEQLYKDESNNLQQLSTDMAARKAYLIAGKSEHDTAQGEAYLQKEQELYKNVKDKKDKLNEQMKWVDPEFHPTQDNLQDMSVLFSMVGIMSSMLGGRGRNSGMNALSSMTGMMEGWKKGSENLYKQERATFEENLKAMKQHNDMVAKQIEDLTKEYATNKERFKDEYTILLSQNPWLKKIDQLKGFAGVVEQKEKMLENMKQIYQHKEKMASDAATRRSNQQIAFNNRLLMQPGGQTALVVSDVLGRQIGPKDATEFDSKTQYIHGLKTLADISKDAQVAGVLQPVFARLDKYKFTDTDGEESINQNAFEQDLEQNLKNAGVSEKAIVQSKLALDVVFQGIRAKTNRNNAPLREFTTLKSVLEPGNVGRDAYQTILANEARVTREALPWVKDKDFDKYYEAKYNKSSPFGPASTTSSQAKVATKADIEQTAKENNLSIDEVKKKLKARGFRIEGE